VSTQHQYKSLVGVSDLSCSGFWTEGEAPIHQRIRPSKYAKHDHFYRSIDAHYAARSVDCVFLDFVLSLPKSPSDRLSPVPNYVYVSTIRSHSCAPGIRSSNSEMWRLYFSHTIVVAAFLGLAWKAVERNASVPLRSLTCSTCHQLPAGSFHYLETSNLLPLELAAACRSPRSDRPALEGLLQPLACKLAHSRDCHDRFLIHPQSTRSHHTIRHTIRTLVHHSHAASFGDVRFRQEALRLGHHRRRNL